MTDTQDNVIEDKNMHIRHLEREIKELTRQNYDLMVRICELGDELRTLRSSLNSLTEL